MPEPLVIESTEVGEMLQMSQEPRWKLTKR